MAANDWDNATWTVKLADQFFSPDFAGEPVTFAVDPDALAIVTGEPREQSVEALASMVRTLVMPGHRFSRAQDLVDRWERTGCDGPPPSLPLLGLTVLAVATSPSFGLYKPFRRLLDPDDGGEGMPGNFDAVVPKMWERLKKWLDEDQGGARGRSTITRHDFFTYIGYSTQQAMLRGSDRPLLYRFFRSIGLCPGQEEIVAGELRRALAIWAKHRLPRTERLHRLATDETLVQYADALLQEMAVRWDGRLRDPRSGSRAAVLRVVLELRPVGLGFAAPFRDGDPNSLAVRDESGVTIDLTRDSGWYEPAPIAVEVTAHSLRHGVELSSEALSFFHEGARAIPFRYDDDLLEWVSTDRIHFDEKHHLLVDADIRAATLRWLDDEGFDGQLDTSATSRLPKEWFLIRNVRIPSRPAHSAPDDVLDLIGSSGGGARLRLVGGLKIAELDRAYLTGGVPNVVLPRGLDDRHFEILKEGFPPIRRLVEEDEFDLCAFDLPAGDYTVKNESTSLPFTILDGYREVPGPGVGTVSTAGANGSSAIGLMSGADHGEPPAIVPSFGRDVFILLGPDSADSGIAKTPRWLEHLAGPLSWVALDAWLPFTPVWLLASTGREAPRYEAFPLAATPPGGPGADTSWGRLIQNAELTPEASDETKALWREYLGCASEALR